MKRFKNILLCLKQPESTDEHKLKHAIQLAKRNEAALKLLSVVEESSGVLRTLAPAFSHIDSLIEEERRKALEALAKKLKKEKLRVSTKLVHGRPHLGIIQEVLRDKHDLVIATSRHSEGAGGFFGTTVLRLMRICPCPVWVFRPGPVARFKRILATLDLSPGSDEREALNSKIMEIATALAASEKAELHVLHVWSFYGESLLEYGIPPEQLSQAVNATHNQSKIALSEFLQGFHEISHERVFLEKGEPGEVIPRFIRQKQIDLVVMGTVARTGIPGFIIGNTAEKVLSQIECSVVAIKPEGFESPVRLE